MAILLFLIPISLLLLGVAIWAFVWSVRGGQYDDLDTAPLDILRADPPPQTAPAAPLADDTAKEDRPRAADHDGMARPTRRPPQSAERRPATQTAVESGHDPVTRDADSATEMGR